MDRNSGAFFRVGPDGDVVRITDFKLGIANTLAWDERRSRMYFVDTRTQTLYKADWLLADGVPVPLREHVIVTSGGTRTDRI